MANIDVIQIAEPLANCPACSARLTQKTLEQVSVKTVSSPFGSTHKKVVGHIRVKACSCGWRALAVPELLGAHPSVPEECLLGHRYCWSLRGRTGFRWDLECCGIFEDNRVCIIRRSVSLQRQGFLSGKPTSQYNRTKLIILAGLSQYPSGVPVGQLVSLTGLTRGQVWGCIQRLVKGKYVLRSEDMEPLVPMGKGFLYQLAKRGKEFIAWAADQGLYD